MSKKERVKLANSYIVGYAKDFITDEECNEMIDLALNEVSIINGEGIIWDDPIDYESETANIIECSAELDNEWANESI
jgi:hypothetical protein